VRALRRFAGFPLNALTSVVSHFLPHVNRDAVYRNRKAEGRDRLRPPTRPASRKVGSRTSRSASSTSTQSTCPSCRIATTSRANKQRVLNGLSLEMALRQRHDADPALANPTDKPPGPRPINRTLRIVEGAKAVLHPNTARALVPLEADCLAVRSGTRQATTVPLHPR